MDLYKMYYPTWDLGFAYNSKPKVTKEAGVFAAAKEIDELLTKLEGLNRNIEDKVSRPLDVIGNPDRAQSVEDSINEMIDTAVFDLLTVKNNLRTGYESAIEKNKKENK